MFPTRNVIEGPTVFDYEDPEPGAENKRSPGDCPAKLPDSSKTESYRTWRIQVLSWLHTQQNLRYLQTSVKDQLVAAMGPATKTSIIHFYQEGYSKVTINEILQYLDKHFNMHAPHEDRLAVQEFEVFTRGSKTLQQFLIEYKALLCRAMNSGKGKNKWKPSTNLADHLMALARITPVQQALIEGVRIKLEEARPEDDKELDPWQKHQFYFEELEKLAAATEKTKFDIESAQIRRGEKKESVHATDKGGKKGKKGKKGKGGKGKRRNDGGKGGKHTQKKIIKKGAANAEAKNPPQVQNAPGTGKKAVKRQIAQAVAQNTQSILAAQGNPWHLDYAHYPTYAAQWSGGGKSKGKKGKGGKAKGKGKGGKGGWQSQRPDAIVPPGWKAERDWRCACGAYNYHYKQKCFSCQAPKPETHGAAVAEERPIKRAKKTEITTPEADEE